MSLDRGSEQSPEVTGVDMLVDTFRRAEKAPEAFRVGMEHEKIGLVAADLSPLPYSGPASIEAVFERLVDRYGFERFKEGEDTIALVKAGTSVSLEPGGQLELSGATLRDIFATCTELTEHRDLTRALGDELGILWLGVGHRPFATKDQVQWVPKTRYRIMRKYLPTRGSMGLDMMLQTGTVQSNFDYASEEDFVLKMRAATAVSSIVSAIYANASIVEGKTVGWASWRQRIWRDVDPDRSGILHFVFDPDFGYRRYIEWALDVPMFFIRRGGSYVGEIAGTPFRHFLENGWDGTRARLSDWNDHLTTLFPEVRAKGYIEVRGADCCDKDLNCAHPALWKGILYDRTACEQALELAGAWTREEREASLTDVARDGLGAKVRGRTLLELAWDLFAISRDGLIRQRPGEHPDMTEAPFLDPIRRVLQSGKSPGTIAAELWDGEFQHDKHKLVEHYRF